MQIRPPVAGNLAWISSGLGASATIMLRGNRTLHRMAMKKNLRGLLLQAFVSFFDVLVVQ